eukprot:2801796-Prymnesium_polylepis.2
MIAAGSGCWFVTRWLLKKKKEEARAAEERLRHVCEATVEATLLGNALTAEPELLLLSLPRILEKVLGRPTGWIKKCKALSEDTGAVIVARQELQQALGSVLALICKPVSPVFPPQAAVLAGSRIEPLLHLASGVGLVTETEMRQMMVALSLRPTVGVMIKYRSPQVGRLKQLETQCYDCKHEWMQNTKSQRQPQWIATSALSAALSSYMTSYLPSVSACELFWSHFLAVHSSN